ncbi:MAG TPA: glycosyltransferase family 39 protein [Streptosporangiaceae bacterium]|nr:glycosyltransferase family 39 protein [Streptosporangiaceae bacterium]
MSAAPPEHSDRAANVRQPGAAVPAAGGTPRPTGGSWTAAVVRSWPVLVACTAMAVAGLWGIVRDSAMGNDEVATHWAALLSLHELAHLLRHVDAVHGLYYLIMHFWVVVGSSPTAMRIPSVISMVVAAGLIAVIGRRLTGSAWAGVFAGLIMAVTPSIVYYAQTARSYALVFACVVGSTLALLHAMNAEHSPAGPAARPRWVAYAALIALGGYLNEMSLLVLAAHAVTVLLARYGKASIKHWLVAGGCGAILVLPLAALSVRQQGAIGWIHRPGLDALRTLFHNYFGATAAAGLIVFALAVIAIVPARDPDSRSSSAWWSAGGVSLQSVALPLLVLPAFLLLVESLVAHPLYVDRYVLYGEAGAALLAGAGAARLGQWLTQSGRSRSLLWVPGVVLCACALVLQLGPEHTVRTPGSREFNFLGPSQYVADRARPGDGVLYFGSLFRKAALGYPKDWTKVTDISMAESPLTAGTFRGTDKPFSITGPLMLKYQRIWVVGGRPSASSAPGVLQQESALLERRFVLVAHARFRGIVVTLWQRR